MSAETQFVDRLLRDFLIRGQRRAKPAIPSRTLRRALTRTVLRGTGVGFLEIPHFWALYVHDGRLAPQFPSGRYFIWWRDPNQDPRLIGGKTPERASELRQLTFDEFDRAWEIFNEAIANGEQSPVVITKQIKKSTQPNRFFDNREGMRGFTAEVNAEGLSKFRAFLARFRGGILFKQINETVTLRL